MKKKFKSHKLEIAKIYKETPDAVSISFKIPPELKRDFSFKSGQYCTFELEHEGEKVRRAYSCSTAPHESEDITVTVKKTGGGGVSDFFNTGLKEGNFLDVFPPDGKFSAELNPEHRKQYFMIAGGSGITPVISIISSILHIEPESSVVLFYANHSEESIIFSGRLQKMYKEHNNRFKIIDVLSKPSDNWEGLKGRLNKDRIISLISKYIDVLKNDKEYFICGPPGLMAEAEKAFEAMNIPKEKIHKESFVEKDDIEGEIIKAVGINKGKALERLITVRLYGEENDVKVVPGEVILQAAMDSGMEPPFSCQIGACATCKAKLISGKVSMDADDALTQEEIDEGFILTCQSHPLTDNVIVDYDEV